MIKKLNKLGTGLLTMTVLVTGMLAAPVGPSGSSFLAPQKAEAACTKYWTVIWDYAGVYLFPGSANIEGLTQRYGQTVSGPSGYYYDGWTRIYSPGYTSDQYFMKSASLSYRGCW
jgi:hypothetical protein